MQLLVTNPSKRRRKARRTRKVRKPAKRLRRTRRVRRAARKVQVIMARARRRSHRRKGPARRRSGHRRRRGGFVAVGGSFSPKAVLMQGAIAGAGAIGVNLLINKIAGMLPASLSSGTGRAIAKAGLGVGLGIAAKKFGMGKYAVPLALGGIAVAVLDVYAAKAGGMSGIDYFGQDGMRGLGSVGALMQTPDGSVYDQAGNLVYAQPLTA